jgi:hypothetical protein
MESFSQIKLSIPTSRAYRCRAAVSQSSSPSQILISRSMAHIVSDPLAFFCQQGDTTGARRANLRPPAGRQFAAGIRRQRVLAAKLPTCRAVSQARRFPAAASR